MYGPFATGGLQDYRSVPQPAQAKQEPPPRELTHAFEDPSYFQQQQQQQYAPPSHGGYGGQMYGQTSANYSGPPPPPSQSYGGTQYAPAAASLYEQPPAQPLQNEQYQYQQQQQQQYQQPPPQPQYQQQQQQQQPQYQQQQQQYQQQQQQPQYQQQQQQPQYQQQQQQQQQQQYQQQQQQPPYQNPDTLRYVAVEVGQSASKSSEFSFDHPSVPRLLPADVEDDLAWRAPAPEHVRPVSQRSIRPTMRVLPSTTKIAETVNMPIGITVNPFAETDVPEVDFTEIGNRVVRCRRCNAYINPFTTFCDRGTRWQCILCRQINETIREYACVLDQNGIRTDIASRPELTHASVDLIASPEYLKSPPRRPIMLLMLDCSYPAVSSGLLGSICRGALAALESARDDEVMRMGIIGYDSTAYFFNLRSTLSAPRMVASPDTVNDISNVNDAFKLDPVELPCAINDLVVPIKDSFHLLKELLEKLPLMFADTKEVGCAFGPALAAAISMLENNGGKILTSICAFPSHGQGALKRRFNAEKLSNQPKEYTMLAAANDWYKQRALACSASSVSVDIIAGSGSEDIDLATIAPLARFTAGHIYAASALTMRGVEAQVQHILSRFVGFDAVLRVRTSPGLVVPNFYGHCYVREPELLSLPVGTEDSSFTVEFNLGPAFKGSFAYVQFAIMYTTRFRERRIRVHTVQLPTSGLYGQIINSVSSVGMACFLTKMCVDAAINGPFAQAQQAITTRLVGVLKSVQQHLAKQGVREGSEKLVLPESMRYIPEILNGFFRSPAVGAACGRFIAPDRRVAAMAAVMSSRPESMLPGYLSWTYQVYSPRTAIEISPVPIYSTRSYLSSRSVTLTVLADAIVLWYGTKAAHAVLEAFGLQPADPNYRDAEAGEQAITPEQIQELRGRTDALVEQLRQISKPSFCVTVEGCPQGKGALEPALARALVEDDMDPLQSYKTYMVDLWRRVTTEK